MRGLLCGTTAKTNEEYKQVVKIRMYRFLCLGLIGAITFVTALLAEFYWKLDVKEQMLGVYTGVGAGLIGASVAMWIKNKRLLGNEEKLKVSRISNADERIKEISEKAFRMAAVVMLVVMYAVALIGGLFYPVLVELLLAIISIFVFVYLVSYFVYSKRM
jgi:Flp pilus assembly protein TadB